MFEAHLAAEPDNSYEAILQTAYRAIFEGKLLGRVKDEAALKKLLDIEDEEGKGQTATS
jgi:hypothetical protein